MIKLQNISKCADKKQILNNINLEIDLVGFVCITGKSGSGKSSLLNSICNITDYKGQILIDGVNIKNIKNLRSDYIGIVYQDFNLIDDITCYENIRLSLSNSRLDDNRETIIEVLEKVGLEKYQNINAKYLSGGEKQRLSIARAIVKKPKIVILDEPTGSLDMSNTKFVFDLLKELSMDCLVLMVSHDNEMVNNYADRIITIDNGRIKIDTRKGNNDLNIKQDPLYAVKQKSHFYLKHSQKWTNRILGLFTLFTVILYLIITWFFSEEFTYDSNCDEKECYVLDSNDKIINLNSQNARSILNSLESKGLDFNDKRIAHNYTITTGESFAYSLESSDTTFCHYYYKANLDYKLVYGRTINNSYEIIVDKMMVDTLINELYKYSIKINSYEEFCDIIKFQYKYDNKNYNIVGISNCSFQGFYLDENAHVSTMKYYNLSEYKGQVERKALSKEGSINFYSNKAMSDLSRAYNQIGYTNGISSEIIFESEEDFKRWTNLTYYSWNYSPRINICPINKNIEIVSGRKPVNKNEIILPCTYPEEKISLIKDYMVVGYYQCDYYYGSLIDAYSSQADFYSSKYGNMTCYSDEEKSVGQYKIISINHYNEMIASEADIFDYLKYLPTVVVSIIYLVFVIVANSKDKYNFAVERSFGVKKKKLYLSELREYNKNMAIIVLIPYILITIVISCLSDLSFHNLILYFVSSYLVLFLVLNLYLAIHMIISTGNISKIMQRKNI